MYLVRLLLAALQLAGSPLQLVPGHGAPAWRRLCCDADVPPAPSHANEHHLLHITCCAALANNECSAVIGAVRYKSLWPPQKRGWPPSRLVPALCIRIAVHSSHLSSSATVLCSISCSTAEMPRLWKAPRPPPQLRQRARSLPVPRGSRAMAGGTHSLSSISACTPPTLLHVAGLVA